MCRMQFLTLAGGDLSYAPLQTTRAGFCELLASDLPISPILTVKLT